LSIVVISVEHHVSPLFRDNFSVVAVLVDQQIGHARL
jgi:hypothetical protein